MNRPGKGALLSDRTGRPVCTNATLLPDTVRIGGQDRGALLEALRIQNVKLNKAARTLFGDDRFVTQKSSRLIRVVAQSVAGLGFHKGATYVQLIAAAQQRGLGECPLELGPRLRLQYPDQPEGAIGFPETEHRAPPGSLTVASAPLDESDETPKGFYLRRIDGRLWLRGYWSWPGHLWQPQDVLVFARNDSAA